MRGCLSRRLFSLSKKSVLFSLARFLGGSQCGAGVALYVFGMGLSVHGVALAPPILRRPSVALLDWSRAGRRSPVSEITWRSREPEVF